MNKKKEEFIRNNCSLIVLVRCQVVFAGKVASNGHFDASEASRLARRECENIFELKESSQHSLRKIS